jgi:hypothetical protein
MDDEFKTYKEWNQQGFRIHKGEKATKFRDGEPLFNCTQVYKPILLCLCYEKNKR